MVRITKLFPSRASSTDSKTHKGCSKEQVRRGSLFPRVYLFLQVLHRAVLSIEVKLCSVHVFLHGVKKKKQTNEVIHGGLREDDGDVKQ